MPTKEEKTIRITYDRTQPDADKKFLYTLAKKTMELPTLTEDERVAFFDDILFRSSVMGIGGCAEYYSTGGDTENMYVLDRAKDGKVRSTIKNYVLILSYDQFFMSLRYNQVAERFELHGEPWTDKVQSKAFRYIEETYDGIKSAADFSHAMNIVSEEISYNPIVHRIERIEWDGHDRIPYFLSEIMGCEDSEYIRECSRLIFHCGISRLMKPGCKVDDVIILQGKQGCGKSTIVEMLAMNDEWFGRVNDIRDNKGAEAVKGKWICEVSELLAFNTARGHEELKSFFDARKDTYRKPYAVNAEDYPRRCIFIGTTNKEQFLTDKTGNRRFYPVQCRSDGNTIHKEKKMIASYIEQCWAQALSLYEKGEIRPYIDPKMHKTAEENRSLAEEDDYRVGLIADYLRDKTAVCTLELWQEALKNGSYANPSRRDSLEIGQIMGRFPMWEREKKLRSFGKYGRQRGWQKVNKDAVEIEEIICQ